MFTASNFSKHCFRQSPSFFLFDRRLFLSDSFLLEKKFGRVFGKDLEEMAFFGRLQQIAEGFLLQIHLLSGLYGSWSRKYDLTPHHLPTTPNPSMPNQPHRPPTPQIQTNHFSKNPYKRPRICMKSLFNLLISRNVCKDS